MNFSEEGKEVYKTYYDLGFKPIRCKGYHPRYNPKQDYRTAKEPVDKGFTADTYLAPSLSEIEEWEDQHGWTGWLIPKGYMALDVEDSWSIKYLEGHFIASGVKPLIHITNNGKHYFFKLKGDLSATTEVYTKLGVSVTYRVGGKNYLIMAPLNGRRWEL